MKRDTHRTMWILHALGYEMPPCFKTIMAARKAMAQNAKEDKATSSFKLYTIKHDKDHIELKIGSKQGIHTYSEYWISGVKT